MKLVDHDGAVTQLTALAQATRLALFRLLIEAGPAGLSAGVIAERLDVAAPTLSFHLKELSRAGLIRASQQGRYVIYSADFDAMNALIAYLTENCCRMSWHPEAAPACAPGKQTRRSTSGRTTFTTPRRRAS
jgi:ArsR family transcriptional regulator, arsenate/arsenite/antimonite-responsive transcriptional repressor